MKPVAIYNLYLVFLLSVSKFYNLFLQVARRQSEFGLAKQLFVRGHFSVNKLGDRAGINNTLFLCYALVLQLTSCYLLL